MLTRIDDRVAPLVSTVRRWAETSCVTFSASGPWINSYGLICLVIFYLQQLETPVLPSINALAEQARPQDEVAPARDGQRLCTYLRDLSALKFAKENTDSLNDLLAGFFKFYASMNFADVAISMNTAMLHTKPDDSSLCIFDPFNASYNVTKRVDPRSHLRFVAELKHAAWTLESADFGTKRRDNSGAWGLLKLFQEYHLRQSN